MIGCRIPNEDNQISKFIEQELADMPKKEEDKEVDINFTLMEQDPEIEKMEDNIDLWLM